MSIEEKVLKAFRKSFNKIFMSFDVDVTKCKHHTNLDIDCSLYPLQNNHCSKDECYYKALCVSQQKYDNIIDLIHNTPEFVEVCTSIENSNIELLKEVDEEYADFLLSSLALQKLISRSFNLRKENEELKEQVQRLLLYADDDEPNMSGV